MTDVALPAAHAEPADETAWSTRKVVMLIALMAVSLLMLYPLGWMISSSFKANSEIFTSHSLIPRDFSFDAYVRGWTGLRISFGQFFLNSLVISLLAVIGNVIACSITAFAFTRLQFAGRQFWFALMLGTMMMPQHAVLIPQYILFLKLGWVNTVLPLVVPKFLAADAFFVFLMVQFFRGLPRELDEAAAMDGCGPWRIFTKIILPLSMPVIATASVFTFIWTWDDFFAPLIYLNDMGSYTVQLGLRTFVDSTGNSDWAALFAMSTLAVIPVFLLFIFFQRLLIEGIATTGMKR